LGDRRLVILALALSAVTLGFHAKYKRRPDRRDVEQASTELQVAAQWAGRTAPNVEVPLLGGGTFRMSDVVGTKVVVLNFFATWCGPCRQETPELVRFASKADPAVLMVGIDVGETPETVARFAKDLGITYAVGLDVSRVAAESLGISSYPTTVVVGPDGKIDLYETGAVLNADVSLAAPVTQALSRLAKGDVATKDAYLAALAKEPPPLRSSEDVPAPALAGRAKDIADAMPCPCGCTHIVARCGCQTAKKIMTKLKDVKLEGRADVDVMKELDAEFCVKGS
jgi:thiol-disulfide isomerase/thioredoxin